MYAVNHEQLFLHQQPEERFAGGTAPHVFPPNTTFPTAVAAAATGKAAIPAARTLCCSYCSLASRTICWLQVHV